MFESAMVNELSVFELLKFDCIYLQNEEECIQFQEGHHSQSCILILSVCYRYCHNLVECIPFSGKASNLFNLPSEKRPALKGKNLLPQGANSFPLEQTPFQVGKHKSKK